MTTDSFTNTFRPKGFTLIEMMVAVALFTIVMTIAIGALTSVIGADRKAQSIQTAVDNLDFALNDMSHFVRTGTVFHCTDGSGDTFSLMGDPTKPQSCSSYGSSYLSVEGSSGSQTNPNDQIVYVFAPASTCGAGFNGGCILKSTQSGATGTFVPITSPEVSIDSARFYVSGACPLSSGTCADGSTDGIQPHALVTMTAHITLPRGGATTLHVETLLTQRMYDL
ncbi:MAG TPA: type II secretion system protein [Candidatus Paceibacterota bacterium]